MFESIKGIFHKENLKVKSVKHIKDDYYVVTLQKNETTDWIPGQHAIFRIKKSFKGRSWHVFSIASTPNSNEVVIGTNISDSPSGFKHALKELTSYDTIQMRGPIGWFTLKKSKQHVIFIALGIGITPFNAMLQSDAIKKKDVTLLYASSDSYLFESTWGNMENVTVYKTTSKEETTKNLKKIVTTLKNDATYYLSGSPKNISSIKKHLKQLGIKRKNMINDPFFGY